MKLKKRKKKPRTKKQPWYYMNFNGECPYFDGINDNGHPIHECLVPWNAKCMDGNIHKCMKLKLKWLASLSNKKRKTELEKM